MRLISIIIPTYNRGHCIKYAIESVLNQKDSRWELIISDDGSTDDTHLSIAPYLEDSRISYIRNQHEGVSAAKNYGACFSKGDYLLFLDSDDTFLPDLIGKLNEIDYYEFDLISWPVLKIRGDKTEVSHLENLGVLYNYKKLKFLSGCICYKKSCFFQAGGFDANLSFGENYELGIRISQIAKNIKLLQKPYLLYNISERTYDTHSNRNRLYSALNQYKKHKKIYQENPQEDAKMAYMLGFLLEKDNKRIQAIKFYSYACKTQFFNPKAFFKVIFLKYLK